MKEFELKLWGGGGGGGGGGRDVFAGFYSTHNHVLNQNHRKMHLQYVNYTIYNEKYFSDGHFSYIVRVIT